MPRLRHHVSLLVSRVPHSARSRGGRTAVPLRVFPVRLMVCCDFGRALPLRHYEFTVRGLWGIGAVGWSCYLNWRAVWPAGGRSWVRSPLRRSSVRSELSALHCSCLVGAPSAVGKVRIRREWSCPRIAAPPRVGNRTTGPSSWGTRQSVFVIDLSGRTGPHLYPGQADCNRVSRARTGPGVPVP